MSSDYERKRLVKRHIAQGEIAQQALRVARADCAELVDGVRVDFRHPSIPPGEWEARAFWYVASEGTNHAGVLFPSEAKSIPEARKKNSLIGEARAQWLDEKEKLPTARPGDCLSVESVVDRISDRRFDHPHDATVKEAYLVLTRENGSQIRPQSPLCFYGKTQLRDGPSRDAYDRLAERILEPLGSPDPHRFEVDAMFEPFRKPNLHQSLPLDQRAALAIEEAEQAWTELVEKHLADDDSARSLLRTALSEAVRAAFYQAKFEAKPAVKAATATFNNLAKGAKTRKKGDRIAAAIELAEKHPQWTRHRIATGVIECLNLEEDKRRAILHMLRREGIGPEPNR